MDNKRKKTNKRRAFFILIGAFVALGICVGASFAYINLNVDLKDENVVTSGCLKLDITESNSINLENSFPVDDISGMNTTPYVFSIKNNCTLDATYVLSLNLTNDTLASDASFVKVAMDGDYIISPILISNLSENILNDKPNDVVKSYHLLNGNLEVGEERVYNLRMWIDYDAPSLNDFTSKIMVEAVVNED